MTYLAVGYDPMSFVHLSLYIFFSLSANPGQLADDHLWTLEKMMQTASKTCFISEEKQTSIFKMLKGIVLILTENTLCNIHWAG